MTESVRGTISTIGRASLRFDYDLSRSCVSFDPDKFLTALHAAGYTIEQDWQPIETAPKDGTPVLVWWAHWCNHPIVASWYVGWSAEEAISSSGPDPTHWRPLPARPADAKDPP